MDYDVAIIGAGPCGLAAAARLREKTPSALFTNDEHARYWKRHNRQANSLEQEFRKRKSSRDSGYGSDSSTEVDKSASRPSMIVLDAQSDTWLGAWHKRFATLRISHLRSPLFFHADPSDRDGLLAFTHESGRMSELRPIPNVVGKELSKHEKKQQLSRKQAHTTARHLRVDGRDEIDYFTPSTQLFQDYCDTIVKRYRLEGLVQQASVVDIEYDPQPPKLDHGVFTITTAKEEHICARIVIIATGPSKAPSVPNLHQLPLPAQKGSITHVFSPHGTELPSHVCSRLNQSNSRIDILIVGGGLTSAQLADLFLRKPAGKIHIHLLLRHAKLKCKPFDISLPWVTKTRNHLMSSFWSADTDRERLHMLRKARDGGSVNPPFAKILQEHIRRGHLTIYTDTELILDQHCLWNNRQMKWTHLSVQPPPMVPVGTCFPFANGIDHIVYCTGAAPNFESVPFLQSLQKAEQLESIGGLPIITDDLMLNEEVPCFFTGALAGLRLGPGAANLAGARQGAERIAWMVEKILSLTSSSSKSRPSQNASGAITPTVRDRNEFTGSFTNQFAALDV